MTLCLVTYQIQQEQVRFMSNIHAAISHLLRRLMLNLTFEGQNNIAEGSKCTLHSSDTRGRKVTPYMLF